MLYPTDYLRVFIWGINGIYDFIALNIGITLALLDGLATPDYIGIGL